MKQIIKSLRWVVERCPNDDFNDTTAFELTYGEAKTLLNAIEERWIPVTERLPKLDSLGMSEDVLTIAGTKMSVKSYDHELKRWNGSPHITITHWMPLPTPPKG